MIPGIGFGNFSLKKKELKWIKQFYMLLHVVVVAVVAYITCMHHMIGHAR